MKMRRESSSPGQDLARHAHRHRLSRRCCSTLRWNPSRAREAPASAGEPPLRPLAPPRPAELLWSAPVFSRGSHFESGRGRTENLPPQAQQARRFAAGGGGLDQVPGVPAGCTSVPNASPPVPLLLAEVARPAICASDRTVVARRRPPAAAEPRAAEAPEPRDRGAVALEGGPAAQRARRPHA